jgi:anti-sigma factor RsiW
MTCAELEILLCDYMDGTLSASERTALENHLSQCSSCAQLASDVAGAAAFLETVPAIEPPAALVKRILRQIPERRSWWSKIGAGQLGFLLEPRVAMGLAMTILSISMVARLARLDVSKLAGVDLNPAKVWQALDDRSYRVWDRTMKYYDDSPLAADIQSRWSDWNQQEQDQSTESGR